MEATTRRWKLNIMRHCWCVIPRTDLLRLLPMSMQNNISCMAVSGGDRCGGEAPPSSYPSLYIIQYTTAKGNRPLHSMFPFQRLL